MNSNPVAANNTKLEVPGQQSISGLRNVTFAYPGQQPVFDGFSCDIPRGEVTAIYGQNGCGKSTLGMLLLGVLEAGHGERWWHDGIDKPGRSAAVYQDIGSSLLPWLTALQNVALSLELAGTPPARARAHAAESLSQWAPSVKHGALPSELSGGQKQLVAWARSLAVDPTLLVLDEPFSALDHAHVAILSTELHRRVSSDQLSVLLITHEMDQLLLLADHVILLTTATNSEFRRIRIDLPRPRGLESLAIGHANELRQQILEATWHLN